MGEPKETIELSLEEGLDLLGALEDARDFLSRLVRLEPLTVADTLGPLVGVEHQMDLVRSKLGIGGDPSGR
jgi:hypothetical protein